MCTSEHVSLESSAAACVAWRASSEPSVARRIFVGNILIGVTSLRYAFSLITMMPSEETRRIRPVAVHRVGDGVEAKLPGLPWSLEEQPEQVDDRNQNAEDHHCQKGGYPESLEHPGCALSPRFSPCPLQLSRQGGVDVPV